MTAIGGEAGTVLEPNPPGSGATDASPILSSSLLAYLSDSAKSSLLSAANIGASTAAKIETALEVIDALSDLTTYLLDATSLNSLANNESSSSLALASLAGSSRVRIVVLLGQFQPTAGGKVAISNGSTTYEITLPSTLSSKRVEFNNIPASFVSSFTVKNSTGVTFPSYGNSIVVVPL